MNIKTKRGDMKKKERCRHERNSWLIAGGFVEWCYVCGAYRNLKRTKLNQLQADSKWRKPSGDKKINPTEQLVEKGI